MKGAVPARGAAAAVALAAGLLLAGPTRPARAANCLVEQSAQTALEQRLAVIDASKTNVNAFFSGSSSCISSNLLSSFDLSNLIPDFAGLLQNGLTTLYKTALDQAKRQVCQIVNSQISDVISRINSATGSYRSLLAGNISSLMGSSSLTVPTGISNFGSFTLQAPTISQLSQATPSVSAPSASVPAASVSNATVAPPANASYQWLQP